MYGAFESHSSSLPIVEDFPSFEISVAKKYEIEKHHMYAFMVRIMDGWMVAELRACMMSFVPVAQTRFPENVDNMATLCPQTAAAQSEPLTPPAPRLPPPTPLPEHPSSPDRSQPPLACGLHIAVPGQHSLATTTNGKSAF